MARVYRRGKVWHAFGYDAAGVRWRESTGQHDRRAAEAIAIEIERRRASRAGEPQAVKLIDALDALLAQDERAHRSAATIEIHTLKGRHLLRVFGPAFDLHHVSRSACTRYNSQKTHCPHGHSYEDALVIVRHDRGGVTERRCRSCQRAQNRRRYRRSRGA